MGILVMHQGKRRSLPLKKPVPIYLFVKKKKHLLYRKPHLRHWMWTYRRDKVPDGVVIVRVIEGCREGRDTVEDRPKLKQWTRFIQTLFADVLPSMSYLSGPKTIPENENRNPFLHGVYSPVGGRLAIRKQKMLGENKAQKGSRNCVCVRYCFKEDREGLQLRNWHLSKKLKRGEGRNHAVVWNRDL